jgi:exonuclease VII large subunit
MKVLQIILFLFLANSAFAQVEIKSEDAAKHVGEKVLIKEAKVVGIYDKNEKVIFFNIGEKHPNQDFSIVIFSENFEKFKDYKKYEGKTISIMGEMGIYKKTQKAQIILNEPDQIEIVN